MSDIRHTPGPWKIRTPDAGGTPIVARRTRAADAVYSWNLEEGQAGTGDGQAEATATPTDVNSKGDTR